MLCGAVVSLEALLVRTGDPLVYERDRLVSAGVLNVYCWEKWKFGN